MNELIQLTKAFQFATDKHKDHRRKNKDASPYINHLAEVSNLLAEHSNGKDLNLIIAGLLHDTVEDTDTTPDELRKEFGEDVTDLVLAVSDDKELPKLERKRLQIENASKKTDRAKMLGIADKISNLRSTIYDPPANWPEKRKQEYFDWAYKVVHGYRGVNSTLEEEFDRVFSEFSILKHS